MKGEKMGRRIFEYTTECPLCGAASIGNDAMMYLCGRCTNILAESGTGFPETFGWKHDNLLGFCKVIVDGLEAPPDSATGDFRPCGFCERMADYRMISQPALCPHCEELVSRQRDAEGQRLCYAAAIIRVADSSGGIKMAKTKTERTETLASQSTWLRQSLYLACWTVAVVVIDYANMVFSVSPFADHWLAAKAVALLLLGVVVRVLTYREAPRIARIIADVVVVLTVSGLLLAGFAGSQLPLVVVVGMIGTLAYKSFRRQ